MSTSLTAAPPADILVGSLPGKLGRNWWALESTGNKPFRWARSGAELFVAALDPVLHTLKLLIEPGPGVGLKPFPLEILEASVPVATVEIVGKQLISVPLPPAGPKVYRLELRASGGGSTTPGDPRALDFRVFSIELEKSRRDVLPPTMKLGMGWYPLETLGDASFRWVNNNAEVSVANPDGRELLEFEIEPGPSAGGKPLHLKILRKSGAAEHLLAEFHVAAREHLEIPLPKGDRLDLIFHADAPSEKVSGESRILNFRLFQYPGA
ncbi:MAG: hypothetical protein ACP5O6_01670 [Candidatus Baltobacteraceae bacterium]